MPHSFDGAAIKHLTQGMTEADMKATLKVAKARNEIIIFRATGPWPKRYIATGKSPTKDMVVKGKSSTWGPMAGCVPVDAALSKAMNDKGVEDGNGYNKKALTTKKVCATQLELDDEDLTDLSTEKWQDDKKGAPRTAILEVCPDPDRGINVRYIIAEKRDGGVIGNPKTWAFFGKRDDPKKQKGFKIFYFPEDKDNADACKVFTKVKSGTRAAREALEAKAQPLEVLARPAKPQFPMTGDYDLFAICPAWHDFGPKDIRAYRFMDDPAYEKRMKAYQAEYDKAQVKAVEDSWKKASAEHAEASKAFPNFAKNKPELSKQMKGKEQILKAGGDSMKLVCSAGCVDPDDDNNPLEFRPDDATCRKCGAKPMFLFYCSNDKCLGEVKDKAGKFKRRALGPEDAACPVCQSPPSAWRAARDYEDGAAMGNVTFRVAEVIKALNKEMGADGFNNRVHHNQEAGRFHAPTDVTEAFPLTLFHPSPDPDPLAKAFPFEMAIIDDLNDLKAYFARIFYLGYYVPLNFAWEIKGLNEILLEVARTGVMP